MKYLFIDICKSDEVYTKHLVQSQEYNPTDLLGFLLIQKRTLRCS